MSLNVAIYFILFTYICIANSYLVYKTTQLICDPSPEYFTNVSCKLKPINRYKAVSNMEVYIIDVLRNVSIDFQTFVKNDANRYYPFVISALGNACDAYEKLKLPILHDIFRKFFFKYTSLNHSCPYRGRVFAHNAYLDEKLLPMIPVPTGFYKGVFRFMEGYPYKNIGNVTAYVQVIEVRNERQLKKN